MTEGAGTPNAESHNFNYDVYLDERKLLIEAARESSRTFDKAILTFAAAAFGFSIAFLKETAPRPTPETLVWLKASWTCFSLGLLSIMLSFLFSHRACTWSIDRTYEQLVSGHRRKQNPWGLATTILNYASVGLVFCAIAFWGFFVFGNLEPRVH